MSDSHEDPHDEAVQVLVRLGHIAVSATETWVRIEAQRSRRRATQGGASGAPQVSSAAPPTTEQRLESYDATPTRAADLAPPDPPHAQWVPAGGEASVDPDLVAIHTSALAFFREQVRDSWVPQYLEARSLSPALEEPWTAGYAPAGWTMLTDHLRAVGWSDEVLQRSGLSRPSRRGTLIDHFRDRLVLPLRNEAGDVVAFIGRCAPDASEGTPKYMNSPRTDAYDKSAVLFGLAESRAALADGAQPVITEGPLDAMAVTVAGRGAFAGVAPCGTALTDRHIALLGRSADLDSTNIHVATDHDEAGDAAAAKAYERLAGRGRQQFRVPLPEGHDPASVLHSLGPERLHLALSVAQRPLVEAAVEHRLKEWRGQLDFVQGRVRAARHVAPLLALLPDAPRAIAVSRLAQRLDLLPSTVQEAVDLSRTRRSGSSGQAAGAREGLGPPSRPSPPPQVVTSPVPPPMGLRRRS